nr:hypothetical protein BaRGS_001139 [Batillaria attramentaria]KAG5714610.1 hypothetical protein BaRGS_000098 [Batillaria attramentaria]
MRVIHDDSRLHDVNVKAEVDNFLKAMADQAKHYTTNHLMVTMGSDFQYQAAHNWYKNLDKLIKYVNEQVVKQLDALAMLEDTDNSTYNIRILWVMKVVASFDMNTGLLVSIKNVETGDTVSVSQNFLYYVGHAGNNSKDDLQASGAYIFRPNSTEAYNLTMPKLTTSSYKSAYGTYVHQVQQQFSPWVSQSVRIYDDMPFVEFEWTVGPIPIDDKQGKEVISRFSTNLQTNGVFYTDANGREVLRRDSLPAPVVFLPGSHYVFVGPISTAASMHRDLGERLFMAPELSFTNVATTYADWSKNFRTTWSGLSASLPDNVHILTLEQFPAKGPVPTTEQPFLLRLEHFYEKGEDAKLSQPVTISLQELFTPFTITEATELTLGANLALSDLKRLNWQTQDGTVTPPLKKDGIPDGSACDWLKNLGAQTADAQRTWVVAGDFNASHRLWDPSATTAGGGHLANAVLESNLSILNDCSVTRIGQGGQRNSAIDVTLASPALCLEATWETGDDNMQSDHLPIHITLDKAVPTEVEVNSNPKYAYDKADWEKF